MMTARVPLCVVYKPELSDPSHDGRDETDQKQFPDPWPVRIVMIPIVFI